MNRRRAFVGAASVAAFCVVAACDAALSTTPPNIQSSDDAGGSGAEAGSGSGGGKVDSGGKSGSGGGDASSKGNGDDSGNPNPGTDSGGSGGEGGSGGLSGNGCAGGTCQNPNCVALGTPVDPGMYPQLGFEAQPSYIPSDTIIPTFDDVPEGAVSPPDPTYGSGSWTKLDLQFLDSNGMHVDFFINTDNWCGDVTLNGECTADIVDILTLHNPANHTIHHPHMGIASTTTPPANPNGCDTAAACDSELLGVETVIDTMSQGGRPHLTRFRAPYGEPYQAQGPGLDIVQPVVAKYAVEVGWNLDCGDSLGASTGQQIATTVQNLIGTAPGQGTNWGIVLQHGTYPWTHDALPILYGPNGYLATHGFKLATVEDAICWKFGMHSWDIVAKLNGTARSPN
jgi:peptidoglycan/xylan/chitin deacetylase (PgdA/CDA1 family)